MDKIHIILDMDSTLIDRDDDDIIYGRPYLKLFLDYCFKTFASVSIWTAASREWYDEVYNKCFKLILGNNKFKLV